MKIYIEELTFKCIIGILDFERQKEQDVIVNLSLTYNNQEEFINYAEVASLVKKRMIKKKFLLIEDALEDLTKKIKKRFPQTQKLHIKITKPTILPDAKVSVGNKISFI